MKLTDLSVRKLKQPESGRKIYFDDVLPGFGVRVSSRSKNFVVLFGQGSARRYKTIGHYPDLTLADARIEAKILLASRGTFRNSTRYQEALKRFLKHCENHNRPSTIRTYRHYLSVFESNKRVSDISRKDIQHHLGRYEQKPSGYSHALTAFKIFFNWCIRQEIIDRHPIAGERTIVIPSRERTLTPEEIKVVWEYDYPHFSTILKLCLLSGQRRSEIAAIEPDWVRDDVLTFPVSVTKNKRRHTIPISEQTRTLMDGTPFGKNGPWNGWSNGKKRIDRFVKIPHWTIHDLRRTYSTVMAEIGTPIHITERLLNHASGSSTSGIVGIYNRYSYLDEMREAQEKYEHCLANITKS